MKKIKLFFSVYVLIFSTNLYGQIIQNCNGNVGIGISASSGYNLLTGSAYIYNGLKAQGSPNHFYGNSVFHAEYGQSLEICSNYMASIYPTTNNAGHIGTSNKTFSYMWSYHYYEQSADKRQKENVTKIPSPLENILKLKGVKYDLKKEYAYNDSLVRNEQVKAKLELQRKNQFGFIAQDVKEVLPQVVIYDDSTDVYGIEYDKFIPVLVEAIKEQQVVINNLKSEIQEIKKVSQSSTFKSTKTTTETSNLQGNIENILYQNAPNPFSQSTTIEYFLTESVQSAMICIYDMNGTQLKRIPIHLTGYENITINGSELKAGMYMYSLIADGQVIDTKQMILTN